MIQCLLSRRRPPTETRAVLKPIRIDAIERPACGSFSHIGKEVFEITPAVTDLNAATSVVGVGDILGVVTTHVHSAPRVVGSKVLVSLRVPMRTVRARATCPRFPLSKVNAGDQRFEAALTAYAPVGCTMDDDSLVRDDGPTPKALTNLEDVSWDPH